MSVNKVNKVRRRESFTFYGIREYFETVEPLYGQIQIVDNRGHVGEGEERSNVICVMSHASNESREKARKTARRIVKLLNNSL